MMQYIFSHLHITKQLILLIFLHLYNIIKKNILKINNYLYLKLKNIIYLINNNII
jgi:hypothetical protein